MLYRRDLGPCANAGPVKAKERGGVYSGIEGTLQEDRLPAKDAIQQTYSKKIQQGERNLLKAPLAWH